MLLSGALCGLIMSLSARRAWIEIAVDSASGTLSDVALRKESVDRNKYFFGPGRVLVQSLSARRAWIEILLVYLALIRYLSLSARRAWIEIVISAMTSQISVSRSPQGERG